MSDPDTYEDIAFALTSCSVALSEVLRSETFLRTVLDGGVIVNEGDTFNCSSLSLSPASYDINETTIVCPGNKYLPSESTFLCAGELSVSMKWF